MQPTIQKLAERVTEARGLGHFAAFKALRDYVHSLSDDEFQREVERVTNPEIFKLLWSVGLSSGRQEICSLKDLELRK